MADKVEEIDQKALDSLMHRVEEAIEHDLALSADDLRLLLSAIHTLATLQNKLEEKDVTLYKLKKLLGMVTSSEKRSSNKGSTGNQSNKKKPKTKPKKTEPKLVHHKHPELKSGDPCPDALCSGKVYKDRPSVRLRVSGHAPFEATKHVFEGLRCNLCKKTWTAPAPKAVLEDGDLNQEYGYSARALMALNKFYSGEGYNHQSNLTAMMGRQISASTNFDQCEYLANDVMPLFYQMKREAASAAHFLGDDTNHRILNQAPEYRPNRNGKGKRLRTGIYSSCIIAKTQQQEIVLFETSLGHLGEFLDDILKNRPPGLETPILMSDALSSNTSRYALTKSLCNAHARRQFKDIEDKYPQVSEILDLYAKIWNNDTQTENMNDHQRLVYHQNNSLPIMQHIFNWCDQNLKDDQFEQNSSLGKAIKYFINHYEGLKQFCCLAGVAIDNNRTEETLKIVIRGRKSYMFFKTANGAGVANVITSLIATAWRAGINVYQYLIDLQRYKALVKENPEQWTPYRYEETITAIQSDNVAA